MPNASLVPDSESAAEEASGASAEDGEGDFDDDNESPGGTADDEEEKGRQSTERSRRRATGGGKRGGKRGIEVGAKMNSIDSPPRVSRSTRRSGETCPYPASVLPSSAGAAEMKEETVGKEESGRMTRSRAKRELERTEEKKARRRT